MRLQFEEKCINTIRCVSAALPQLANSGHPGAPMGCAPMAHLLYGKMMRYSPKNPNWLNRDRFVLSNGHGCALQYTMLYLCGYDLSLDDLKQFRQLHSKTPGHPERGCTPGVEVTTGPLGQGLAQGVGLAVAATMMVARFNKPDYTLFDPYIYVIVGDGCLQEGVASEACSLAGHLGLGRLIVFYDSNNISIDGQTSLSFSENVELRFRGYGWDVLYVEDADNDIESLERSICLGKQNLDKPTIILCKTTIGFGSQKEGSEKVHGAPLGLDDLKQCRKKFQLQFENENSPDALLHISSDVHDYYKSYAKTNEHQYEKWVESFETVYRKKYPELYKELKTYFCGDNDVHTFFAKEFLHEKNYVSKFTLGSTKESTRSLSGKLLNHFAELYPIIVGGSADLTTSNCTALKCTKPFTQENVVGRYIHYGVREHGMAAITNGIQAFGGFKPFCATFLNFITYAWGAVRLSALSHLSVLFIMTHDSIELGQDGPTHQPIEVASLCRATPNLYYFRPADEREVLAGYITWLCSKETPVVLALSRDAVPSIDNSSTHLAKQYGAYIIKDFDKQSEQQTKKQKAILVGSGTEVHLCVEAAKCLKTIINTRVVSMPCWELFQKQKVEYQLDLFPKNIYKLYIEASHVLNYSQWFNDCIQITQFGASAPKEALMHHFGFHVDHIIEKVKRGTECV